MNKKYIDGVIAQRKQRRGVVWLCVKVTVCLLAVLFLALAIALIVDIVGMKIEYTHEAGEQLPTAAYLCGEIGAEYDFGDGDGNFSVGEHEIYIVSEGRRIRVILTVVDTKAPEATLITLKVNKNGPFPEASDFFSQIEDASEYSAKFTNQISTALGTHEVKIRLEDKHSNGKNYGTFMEVIEDTEAPVITAPASITGSVGGTIAYKKAVSVTDNCFGDIKLDVDTSDVKLDRVGEYRVTYTATDSQGNSASCTLTLKLIAKTYTEREVMDKVAEISESLGITKTMSHEEKIVRIYGYVNSPTLSGLDVNIRFDDAEKPTNHTDWVTAAGIALYENPVGDCYTFFAVSKAFFEYFGIENLDIEREEGARGDGTHFWSMVNIGTKSAPRWYYYDATRLQRYHKTGSGCLFTEAQRLDYTQNVSRGFLDFDATGYPEVQETVINKNYKW